MILVQVDVQMIPVGRAVDLQAERAGIPILGGQDRRVHIIIQMYAMPAREGAVLAVSKADESEGPVVSQ
jgi:hypothetical protein